MTDARWERLVSSGPPKTAQWVTGTARGRSTSGVGRTGLRAHRENWLREGERNVPAVTRIRDSDVIRTQLTRERRAELGRPTLATRA